MTCQKCIQEPVYLPAGSKDGLCRTCFFESVEKKVAKTIREWNLIEKNDHLGVAVSGGKDSTVVLYLLANLAKERRDLKLTAIAVDEGIQGYRDKTLGDLKTFCQQYKINLHITSFQEVVGKPLDELVKKYPHACSICGVFRRYLLNQAAKKLQVTKLVTGHNLDDEAQAILMNQFKHNPKLSARMGPITGTIQDPKFIPRIKPLYFVSEKETATFAYLQGWMEHYHECPYAKESYRAQVRDMLYDFEAKFPGTRQNIVNSFLATLPILKQTYKQETMQYCEECGEPSTAKICRTCTFILQLNLDTPKNKNI